MKTSKLPNTDSIQELARFWDTHDLTDFEGELEEVAGPVFASDDTIQLHLPARDVKAIRRLAESEGVSQAELIQKWVLQKLGRVKRGGQARGPSVAPGSSRLSPSNSLTPLSPSPFFPYWGGGQNGSACSTS
jgi:hypothetical protein